MPLCLLLDAIREEVKNNDSLQKLCSQIIAKELDNVWSVHDGLSFYKGRIYLLSSSPLIATDLSGYHDGAHEGV